MAGAAAGFKDAGDDFEHGRLSGAIGSQNAEHVALAHRERYVVDGSKFLEHKLALGEGHGIFFQAVQLLAGHVKHHRYVVDVNHYGPRVDDAALISVAGQRGSVYDFGHDISRLNVENELLLGLFKYK